MRVSITLLIPTSTHCRNHDLTKAIAAARQKMMYVPILLHFGEFSGIHSVSTRESIDLKSAAAPQVTLEKNFRTCVLEAASECSRIIFDLYPEGSKVGLFSDESLHTATTSWDITSKNSFQFVQNLSKYSIAQASTMESVLEISLTSIMKSCDMEVSTSASNKSIHFFAISVTKQENLSVKYAVDMVDKIKGVVRKFKENTVLSRFSMDLTTVQVSPLGDGQSSIQSGSLDQFNWKYANCSVKNLQACLHKIMMDRFEIQEISVTHIPIRDSHPSEESNSARKLLTVPLFVSKCILSGNREEFPQSIRWINLVGAWKKANPLANPSRSLCRVTAQDVTSGSASCLLKYVCSGKTVPLGSGEKTGPPFSQALSFCGGEVFLYSFILPILNVSREPSSSSLLASELQDYRIQEFANVVRKNILCPSSQSRQVIEVVKETPPVQIHMPEALYLSVGYFPLRKDETIIFNPVELSRLKSGEILQAIRLFQGLIGVEITTDTINHAKHVVDFFKFQASQREGNVFPSDTTQSERNAILKKLLRDFHGLVSMANHSENRQILLQMLMSKCTDLNGPAKAISAQSSEVGVDNRQGIEAVMKEESQALERTKSPASVFGRPQSSSPPVDLKGGRKDAGSKRGYNVLESAPQNSLFNQFWRPKFSRAIARSQDLDSSGQASANGANGEATGSGFSSPTHS